MPLYLPDGSSESCVPIPLMELPEERRELEELEPDPVPLEERLPDVDRGRDEMDDPLGRYLF